MVEALPQPVRLRLEQALGQFRHWSEAPAASPIPVAVLEGGRSNTSVLVEYESRRWVVRIDGKNPASLGISRSAEWRALNIAAQEALAPTPAYQNPDLGALVCEYCEPTEPNSWNIADVAELLRGIHALPPIRFRLDPIDRARRYLNLAGGGEPANAFIDACQRLSHYPHTLCHNDLLQANRLFSKGRLLAIDWEYVAMGDPYFDLAVIIEGDALDQSESGELLRAWQQSEPGEEDQQRLADNRLVYRELTHLWEQVYEASPGDVG